MPPGGWIFSYILQKVVTESTFNVSELEWKRIERGCTYTYSQLTLKWMSLDCGRCTTDL